MSAPSVSGRVCTGEAAVESTASRAPASCATSAAAAMSVMVQSGFEGVSIQTSLVRPGETAARSPSTLSLSTKLTESPHRGASVPSQLRSAQYITLDATTWSPGSRAWNTAVAAAIPEEKRSAPACASSSMASTASASRTVALSGRP
jgi:hypothetical protein